MDKSEFNDFVFIDDIEPIWCNSIDKDNVIIQPNDIFIQELKNQLDDNYFVFFTWEPMPSGYELFY